MLRWNCQEKFDKFLKYLIFFVQLTVWTSVPYNFSYFQGNVIIRLLYLNEQLHKHRPISKYLCDMFPNLSSFFDKSFAPIWYIDKVPQLLIWRSYEKLITFTTYVKSVKQHV